MLVKLVSFICWTSYNLLNCWPKGVKTSILKWSLKNELSITVIWIKGSIVKSSVLFQMHGKKYGLYKRKNKTVVGKYLLPSTDFFSSLIVFNSLFPIYILNKLFKYEHMTLAWYILKIKSSYIRLVSIFIILKKNLKMSTTFVRALKTMICWFWQIMVV